MQAYDHATSLLQDSNQSAQRERLGIHLDGPGPDFITKAQLVNLSSQYRTLVPLGSRRNMKIDAHQYVRTTDWSEKR